MKISSENKGNSSSAETKHNSIWSKALSMPLTIWNFVLVIYLSMGGNWVVIKPSMFATRYVSFAAKVYTR